MHDSPLEVLQKKIKTEQEKLRLLEYMLSGEGHYPIEPKLWEQRGRVLGLQAARKIIEGK